LQPNKGKFVSSINNANNLYFVAAKVNNFKLTFFQANGASKKSKDKRTEEIQSATMKYVKDLQKISRRCCFSLCDCTQREREGWH